MLPCVKSPTTGILNCLSLKGFNFSVRQSFIYSSLNRTKTRRGPGVFGLSHDTANITVTALDYQPRFHTGPRICN